LIDVLSPAQLNSNLTAMDHRGHTAFAKACLDDQKDVAKILLTVHWTAVYHQMSQSKARLKELSLSSHV
jgi:hypothetical protein